MSSGDEMAALLKERLDELLSRAKSLENYAAIMSQETTLLADGPLNSGDTCLMLAASALVLLMTVPGVGLYYSGMVNVSKVMPTLMQSFSIVCVITSVYFAFGYSLAFGSTAQGSLPVRSDQKSTPFYGDASRLWLVGLGADSVHQAAPSVPESAFCLLQLCYAILAASLVCGSFADRLKHHSMLAFIALWHLCVYCPIAHANWCARLTSLHFFA